MSILKSLINNSPDFRLGYQCAIDDLKVIFENAKIFNPNMDIVDLVDDWEKIVTMAQRKISGEKDN
jgi:hypothetical protein